MQYDVETTAWSELEIARRGQAAPNAPQAVILAINPGYAGSSMGSGQSTAMPAGLSRQA